MYSFVLNLVYTVSCKFKSSLSICFTVKSSLSSFFFVFQTLIHLLPSNHTTKIVATALVNQFFKQSVCISDPARLDELD